jgi:hypothetical protein
LWLLYAPSPLARIVVWLFVVETVVDLLNATVMGIRGEALASAHDVTWLILCFYVPALWSSLVLLMLQLVTRRAEQLDGHFQPRLPDHAVRPVQAPDLTQTTWSHI